jgi:spore germination cell wall hydrolase CwlJ-like protein
MLNKEVKRKIRRFRAIILITIFIIVIVITLKFFSYSQESNQGIAFNLADDDMMNLISTRVIISDIVAKNEKLKEVVVEVVTERANTEITIASLRGADTIRMSKEDYDILCRIVEAEITEGDIQQKINVAQTVINRVESPRFPDTVKEVVFAKKQFCPIRDGRYYKVSITDETEKAVNSVLQNPTNHNALFFKAVWEKSDWSNYKFLFTDGKHNFYTTY